ncbi:P-loop NTPase fold protein, partial [Enterococcus hirae]|uniref:P-loop NTPase fold protein n=2 Tax=Enterococcus TaxID=1350 RepID=UPI001F4F25E1
IDTTEAVKMFSKLIKEKKTFFLNGTWGSGKTEFLNRVSNQAEEKNFIFLKLWELKDEIADSHSRMSFWTHRHF